jgi:threonine/homoserine efflux transporter RhtA
MDTRGSLLPLDLILHGWALIAANVVFYIYLYWLGFWFVRGTHGRERVVMVGWFATILLSPLETLQRGWVLEVRYLCTLGLAVALPAAVSLLLHPTALGDSTGRPA